MLGIDYFLVPVSMVFKDRSECSIIIIKNFRLNNHYQKTPEVLVTKKVVLLAW